MDGEPLRFDADDGTPLAGTLYEPEAPLALLVLHSGTGIPQGFYRRFAARATEHGFAVLTYDYRGICASAPEQMRGHPATYRDWGHLDVPAAHRALMDRHPGLPLTVVGHSTGGQQLGLAHNVDQVQAALFVAVSTGYWKWMPLRQKAVAIASLGILAPVLGRLVGYVPAKRLGMAEDLPLGVAMEWWDWCNQPDYMAAYFDGARKRCRDGRPFGPTFFDQARFPLRAYFATDDPIATKRNVPPLLDLYTGADQDRRWIDPADHDLKEMGHMGFFRRGIGDRFWDEALGWLKSRVV